jgi:hypothetical protein
MSEYDAQITRLARRVSRGNNTSSIRLPRAPQLSLHMGTLADVDNNTNTAHFEFNDPSGLIVPGVRVVQAYGGTNQPAIGHTVWAYNYGTDFMIIGQHIIPTNIISP